MNNWVGDYDALTGKLNFPWTPDLIIVKKLSDMTEPSPTKTFVLLDERDDSSNVSIEPEFQNRKGSAPASGAVFRAHAENQGPSNLFRSMSEELNAQQLDARARPATPEAGLLPQLRSSG